MQMEECREMFKKNYENSRRGLCTLNEENA
jgi:hypothetical protein